MNHLKITSSFSLYTSSQAYGDECNEGWDDIRSECLITMIRGNIESNFFIRLLLVNVYLSAIISVFSARNAIWRRCDQFLSAPYLSRSFLISVLFKLISFVSLIIFLYTSCLPDYTLFIPGRSGLTRSNWLELINWNWVITDSYVSVWLIAASSTISISLYLLHFKWFISFRGLKTFILFLMTSY